jgi:hypothetical protein
LRIRSVVRDVFRKDAFTVQLRPAMTRERTLKVMIVRLPTVARSLQARRIVFAEPALVGAARASAVAIASTKSRAAFMLSS